MNHTDKNTLARSSSPTAGFSIGGESHPLTVPRPGETPAGDSHGGRQPSPAHIRSLGPGEIFVFGSNERGLHGAGAARTAMLWFEAALHVGHGQTGRCYAIPTKDRQIKTLPLWEIARYVNTFVAYAKAHPGQTFLVTEIGCGLAGYTPAEIAPMFADAPQNVRLPKRFLDTLYPPETQSTLPRERSTGMGG